MEVFMIRGLAGCVIFIVTALAVVQAQNINLSGIVSNSSGQAVAGAVVTLAGLNKKDTTDANGAYSFTTTTGSITAAPVLPSHRTISLTGGVLSIALTGSTPLAIDLFDMRGRLIDRQTERNATAGEYRFDISRQRYATKMLLLRVAVGGETSVLRYLPATGGISAGQSAASATPAPVLAKAQAVVDTLKVEATGYRAAAVTIESYQTVKNISLEAVSTLDKFSFFVTSMAGLQELSGSENGFGGDLRFGKTGQGAGLLGADSICACLAEMSMPGSAAKKWSAFLSAEKGVDGNQVNAIDRIGEGPWYDRMGRLVANNKQELLNERPSNADAAIINDLPNEYGIPNHRPDPTMPIVDNHMTVTGSDAKGELYTGGGDMGGWPGETSEFGYTCDDWTSTTIRAQPRCGLSWPQSIGGNFGMKNWISSFNASGCEAGYDLDESTMAGLPGVYTIGNGGGYGGFYCFAHQP